MDGVAAVGDALPVELYLVVGEFLEGGDFESIEALNEALQEKVVGRDLDELKVEPRNAREEAQGLCFQAFEASGRGQLQLAKKALELDPELAEAHTSRGFALQAEGQLEASLEAIAATHVDIKVNTHRIAR